MINYSIIIPHKNIPRLLQRCLDSIPRREDVQIIVVDDNSDVDKVDFANFPGLNDSFVEIVFGKNEKGRKGAGYARNLGLEKAKGKWLVFADADDFFDVSFEQALDKYKDDENDIIYFYVSSVDSETLQPINRHVYLINRLLEIQSTNNWDTGFDLCTPWGKFIKREFVERNRIRFQEVQYANDVLFIIKIASIAKKKISEDKIYIVTGRSESLTATKGIDPLIVRFLVTCDVVDYLKNFNKEKYFKDIAFSFWLKIHKMKKTKAINLLPRMVRSCGLYFVIKRLYKLEKYYFL